MNILPKKRWHVRTRDNIARVRRDEAVAKEEELKRQQKLQLAESEARIHFLRKKSSVPESYKNERSALPTETTCTLTHGSQSNDQNHVNLFADYRSHIKKTNKASEEEKKEEREKYEKQIGYLTYLGQDTNEALKLRSWYEIPPQRAEESDDNATETDLKNKACQDPLTLIKALLPGDQTNTLKVTSTKYSIERRISPSLIVKKLKNHKHGIEKLEYTKLKKGKKHRKHKKDTDKRKKKSCAEVNESDAEYSELIKREKIEKLRKERLLREASERARQEALLAPQIVPQGLNERNVIPTQRIIQKYNSQFNPDIAKQNMA